eukprot:3609019-Rhodomonas_salina.2
MAFSSAVKLRPGSAKSPGAAHQNVNPGPLKSDQDDRLGYGSGVVERCDSVDLIMPNKNWDSPQKDKPHKPAFQPPVKNLELGGGLEGRIPSWKALPSRAFAGQRPSSAHVQGYRGGHGFERPLKPASPQIAVRGIENQNQVLSNSPKRPGQPRQAEQGLNGIVGVRKFNASLPQERVEEVEKPAEVANNSVEASEDGTSQIEQLRYMLRRQEAEKRNIERHNNALVHQNAELKEQVAHLAFEDFANAPTVQKPRQRPWSASSAQGSISGRHALRIPNGAYPPNPRMQQQQQGFQRSTVRGGSRGSSAQSNGYNGRSPVRPGSSSMAGKLPPPGARVCAAMSVADAGVAGTRQSVPARVPRADGIQQSGQAHVRVRVAGKPCGIHAMRGEPDGGCERHRSAVGARRPGRVGVQRAAAGSPGEGQPVQPTRRSAPLSDELQERKHTFAPAVRQRCSPHRLGPACLWQNPPWLCPTAVVLR